MVKYYEFYLGILASNTYYTRGIVMGKEISEERLNKVKSLSEEKANNNIDSAAVPKSNASQYVGISLVMLAFLLAAVVASITGGDFMPENLVMTFVMALSVILASVGFLTISIVFGALSIVAFAAYKIFSIVVSSDDVSWVSFFWVILPAMAVGGIALFISGNSKLALENALLKKQISGLITMDPLTGLYNLRSMYMDIQTQISYSERNNVPFSLMIIRLRYPQEMRKVLRDDEYKKLIKQLSLLLVDTVRLEDKVYAIDEEGGFGIILTCDKDGTRIVEKRLRGKLKDTKWFENVSSKHQIRAELKIGYLQYDKEIYMRDAHSYKESVEEEVQYDIDNYEYDVEVTDFSE